MTHEAEPAGEPMRILECDPPRRLVVEWVQQDSDAWRVDLDLTREGDRTVLRFVQVFGPDADVVDYAMGWHWYLDKFGAEVEGTSGPGTGTPSSPRPAPPTAAPDPSGEARPAPSVTRCDVRDSVPGIRPPTTASAAGSTAPRTAALDR